MALNWPPEWLGDLAEVYPFTPNQIELDGNRLSYLDEGDKNSPCIALLHGNPTWSFYYRNMVLALRKNCRVIVPDHIGCGLSDKPQEYNYTLQNHISNFAKLMDHLGIDSFSLGVHDWGGAIGFGYAVDHVEKIKSLIVFNTAAFLSSRIPFRIWICRLPLFGQIAVLGFNGFARSASAWGMATSRPDKFKSKITNGYLAPYNSWKNRIATLRFVQDIPLSPVDQSYNVVSRTEKGLEGLANKPMIIMWGMDDWCFDSVFLAEWERRFPEAAVHRFKGAGHFVVEDEGDEVASLALEFLKQHG